MRLGSALVMLGAVLALASCAESEREWMKVSEPYTVESFRRDYAECSRKGKLDEACMRERGWVDVKRPAEKAPPPPERPTGRY